MKLPIRQETRYLCNARIPRICPGFKEAIYGGCKFLSCPEEDVYACTHPDAGKSTTLAEAVKQVSKLVGCGDNSCLFIESKGMSTNGGCTCRDKPFVMAALAQLYRAARKEVKE